MSDVIVSTNDPITTVTTTDNLVEIAITNNPVEVSTSTAGVQGASYNQGDPIYVTVRNATGATLPKGTIVYTSGAAGNHTLVEKALATGDVTSARTLGWVANAIANNADGFVVVEGYLDGIDTDHIAEGSQLYLSPTVAGSFTATKPSAPEHMVYVGVVTKSNPGNGRVLVKVQNGYELEELHDVQIVSPVNNQVLTYDSATNLWKNATNPADGVTSITATAPLTGGTITSTGSIGLDQTALSIAQSQVSGLVTALAGKANLAGNNTYSGAQTIVPSGIAQVPMVLRSLAGQTSNMLEIQDETTGTYASITRFGTTRLGGSTMTGGRLMVQAGGALVGLQVRDGGTGANMAEFQNSSGTTLLSISSLGGINNATAGNISLFQRLGGSPFIGTLSVGTNSASQIGLAVRGVASQSANLQEWQDSAGTILSRVSSGGQFISNSQTYIGAGATSILNTRFNLATGSSSVVGQVIRGASGQTADLLELQDSSGTDLLSINASGGLVVGTTHLPGASPGLGQIRTSTNTGLNYVDTTSNDSANTGPGYTARRSRGTLTSPTQVQANDLLFGIFAQGYNNASGFSGNSAAVRMLANENFTTTGVGSSIVFETASDGTTGRLERMRVTGSGTVSVGTTSNLAQLGVVSSSATNKGLVIRGAASQTANLIEAQNSAGSNVFIVDPSGIVRAFNAFQGTGFLNLSGQTVISIANQRNVGLATGSGSYGGGQATVFIGEATVVPTTNPTGGGILYVEAGALKYRGTSGTITTIANA